MFSSCTVRFGDDRPEFEHDVQKAGGHIVLNYTNGTDGPNARLMVLSDEHEDGKRTIIAAYGISNFHLASMTEISIQVTGFVPTNPDPMNSMPDQAHRGGVRVRVSLELPTIQR